MATFRIHEDLENRHPAKNSQLQKNNLKSHQVQKRSVLGALENTNKNTKHVTNVKPAPQSLVDLKIQDENAFAKQQAARKPIPVVPVAQFEAFKVYEDKPDETKDEDVKLVRKDVKPDESPMSIEKSLIVVDPLPTPVKPTRMRLEKDVFFEMPEYRDDIHRYLREAELRSRPKPGYMKKQPDITYAMRTILVDWLVEVAEEYRLQTETLYLAVAYIDRFLSYISVIRAKLQLVGTAAMFIASKYEEIYPPDIGEFVYITDDTYTKKQVLRMEQLILKVLGFDLSIPTPLTFLSKYCVASDQNERTLFLAMYICELALLEADPFLQYLPSMLAAGSIHVARETLELEPWTSKLEDSTGYTYKHLKVLLQELHGMFNKATTLQQQAIQEKYKKSKFQHVGMVLPRSQIPVKEDGDNKN